MLIEGRLIDHDDDRYGQVEIDPSTGLIARVSRHIATPAHRFSGLVFPGFGDLHVHAREDPTHQQDHKEDYQSTAAAAIAGGVVHYADMPNTPRPATDDQSYAEKEALARRSPVHVTVYAGIGPDSSPLRRSVPYKAFTCHSVNGLHFESYPQFEETIQRYRGEHVSIHCEDPAIIAAAEGEPLHELRRPPEAEASGIRFAAAMAERYGLCVKICHLSNAAGLAEAAAAKRRGLPLTVEVAPHHLFFDATMLTAENRPWLQMNPPLRSPEDRTSLLEALRTGLIDYLATDHAPHTAAEKLRGISGVPHLDTYGAFATWLLDEGFAPQDIARACAYNPARFVEPFLPVGLGRGFGRIEEGYAGSLTVLDPAIPTFVPPDGSTLKTKCGWSPFEGFEFPGSVAATIVRGRVYRLG